MKIRYFLVGVVATATTLLMSCGSTERSYERDVHHHHYHDSSAAPHAHGTIVNDYCPCMNSKATSSYTVTYQGQPVGFCCPNCVAKWNSLDDSAKAVQYTTIVTRR
jgi:hypothetical protein